MPRLAPKITLDKLRIILDVNHIKHATWGMRLKIKQQVILEVKKLVEAGFIRE